MKFISTRGAGALPKSKYETHVLPYLERIAAWAEKGATAKEIAGKLNIAYSTFRKYLDEGRQGDERYAALAAAFAQACEVPDDAVEAALFKRACGIEYTEVRKEEVLDRKTGRRETLTTKITKYIPPDPTSAMFWLANRRREKWSYKPEGGGESEGTGVVELAPVDVEPVMREDEGAVENGE